MSYRDIFCNTWGNSLHTMWSWKILLSKRGYELCFMWYWNIFHINWINYNLVMHCMWSWKIFFGERSHWLHAMWSWKIQFLYRGNKLHVMWNWKISHLDGGFNKFELFMVWSWNLFFGGWSFCLHSVLRGDLQYRSRIHCMHFMCTRDILHSNQKDSLHQFFYLERFKLSKHQPFTTNSSKSRAGRALSHQFMVLAS